MAEIASWTTWRPSWFSRSVRRLCLCAVSGINILAVSTEISWSIWLSSTSNEHQHPLVALPLLSPSLGGHVWQDQARPGCPDQFQDVCWDPATYDKKSKWWLLLTPRPVSKAYTEVCLPTSPVVIGYWEVPGGNSHPGGEEKGEGHDPSSGKQLMRLWKQAEKNK